MRIPARSTDVHYKACMNLSISGRRSRKITTEKPLAFSVDPIPCIESRVGKRPRRTYCAPSEERRGDG